MIFFQVRLHFPMMHSQTQGDDSVPEMALRTREALVSAAERVSDHDMSEFGGRGFVCAGVRHRRADGPPTAKQLGPERDSG